MHAISVHEVRDMFGALPELAAELREIASTRFIVPAVENQPRGLIHKIGPMFKRDPLQIAYPADQPTPRDWESLIEGCHIEGERLVHCWRVVDAWLEARDRGTATFTLSPGEVEAFDFALTRAGLPSQLGLRNLLANDLAIPLRPAQGMRTGYAKNAHVMATHDCLTQILPEVDPEERGRADYLASFLDAFADWTRAAREADAPVPDLVVVWWETARGQQPAFDPTQPIITGRQERAPRPGRHPRPGRSH